MENVSPVYARFVLREILRQGIADLMVLANSIQNFDLDKERKMLFKVREDVLERLVDEKLTER